MFFVAIFFLGSELATAQTAKRQLKSIDPLFAEVLVRDTLTAVNHGNWTGNYTVLRDLASPNFAIVNDATKLASIFEPIRARQLDLRPILAVRVVLTKDLIVLPESQLQLSGYFPMLPEYVRFDLIFEPINGRWRLLGIGLGAADPADFASREQGQSSRPNSLVPVGLTDTQEKRGSKTALIPLPKRRPPRIGD